MSNHWNSISLPLLSTPIRLSFERSADFTMVKHNNVVPNAHFRKQWQRRVKTWFSQPFEKKARREARAARIAKMAPRPAHLLRPVVRC